MDGKSDSEFRIPNSELDEREYLRGLYGIPPESALLLLVRHGETTWNAESRVQGQTDSPLSDLGISQARCLAERLKDEPIHVAYSSDLARAVETAQIIAQPHNVEVATYAELREGNYGEWEEQTDADVQSRWPEVYAQYISNPAKVRLPGGESVVELVERAYSCAQGIAQRHVGENALIVAHGGSVRGVICGILGGAEHFWRFKTNNASLTVIEWKETGPRVIVLNDVCHLGLPSTIDLQP